MAFLVVLDGSINFDALRLEMLQAQILHFTGVQHERLINLHV